MTAANHRNPVISIRVGQLTRSQLDNLSTKWGMSLAQVVTTLADRATQQELIMTSYTGTTIFDTKQDALDAGFTTAKAGGRVKDTSGPNEFGYAFTEYDENGNSTSEAVAVWLRKDHNKMGRPGCVVMMFPPTA